MNPPVLRMGFLLRPGLSQEGEWGERIEERCSALGILVTKAGIDESLEARERVFRESDLVVVLGGDGTFLQAAVQAALCDVPLLGVNRGGLGFLTEFTREEFFLYLDSLAAGGYSLKERSLLDARVGERSLLALNDVVFTKESHLQMVRLRIVVNRREFCVIRADGLIVSSPTGSTAYNLSAGGPILEPEGRNIVITPICSHSLTLRPVVLAPGAEVEVEVLEGNLVSVNADGRNGISLLKGKRALVSESRHRLRVVTNPDRDYFALLREKLKWG